MFLKATAQIRSHSHVDFSRLKLKGIDRHCHKKIGASEGIRTLDTHVGNVMLYQAELRSLPFRNEKAKANRLILQALFVALSAVLQKETFVRVQKETG